jgi:hypothetical protein
MRLKSLVTATLLVCALAIIPFFATGCASTPEGGIDRSSSTEDQHEELYKREGQTSSRQLERI